jgi:hypothetical protein
MKSTSFEIPHRQCNKEIQNTQEMPHHQVIHYFKYNTLRFETTDEMLQQVFRAMCENNRKWTARDSFLTPVFTIIFHKSVYLRAFR